MEHLVSGGHSIEAGYSLKRPGTMLCVGAYLRRASSGGEPHSWRCHSGPLHAA